MRTDIHRPSAPEFDPEAYRCQGVYYLGNDGYSDRQECSKTIAQLVGQGYHFGSGSSTNCGHCGAFMLYSALMIRDDIKEFIFVGETCLDNRFDSGITATQFQQLRKQTRLNRQRATRQERTNQILADLPWLPELAEHDQFLNDLYTRLVQHGELSEKQIDAARNAAPRVRERIARRAQIEAEKATLVAAGIQAPEGRIEITGEIVSIKEQESIYGITYKMVVKTDEGWCVWSTIPRALADAQRGEIVTFTATLTRSDNDPLFAFAKNPTVRTKK